MIFPHSFYEDEVRCDYLIPSMVKRTWAAQIEILADLDRACQKNSLSYFAEWGTLLGTVRHEGFIPWDDDVDIAMKRSDYEYFINNVNKLLPDNYSIVNYRSNRNFNQMLSRIVSSDHYRFDPEYLHKYSGLPLAMGIDIFPLDFLTDDREYEADRERRVNLVYDVVNEIAIFHTPIDLLSDSIKQIEKEFDISIDRQEDVLTSLRDLLVSLFSEVKEEDSSYITLYPLWLNSHDYVFPADYYRHGIRMRFENTTIPVPVCYEDILKKKYGSSFMTCVRSGGAHEYPYYEKHVNILRSEFGYEWPEYKFNEKDLVLPKETDDHVPKKCLFVTYGILEFENMRRVAKEYLDEGYEVSILPITKFEIAPDMTEIVPCAVSFCDELYVSDLPGAKVIHDENIGDDEYDTIVTDYQYDEYNLITTVDRKYYSSSLRRKCKHLVYVPAHEALSIKPDDERAKKIMPSYVNMPIVMFADTIILRSDESRDRYIECLNDFSQNRYGNVWEKKIKVIPDPDKRETDPVKTKTGDHRMQKKKILFYIGISSFAMHKEKVIDKLKNVFDIFDDNSDKVDVIFELQEGLEENLKEMFPDLYEKFSEYEGRINREEIGIEEIDAYYGEASALATMMQNEKKPVMIYACDTDSQRK